MKISAFHPYDKLDIDFLEKYDKVSEVFLKGPAGEIGSARENAYDPSESELRKLCQKLHDRGFEVNVVLNATCFGGEQFRDEWIRKTVDVLTTLASMGVDSLTVADPYLIELINYYALPFKVTVSCLAFVTTPMKARYFDEIGVDRITLPPDVNRDLDTIRMIRKAVKCDLSMIVNEGCLLNCPYRYFCYNYITHRSTGPTEALLVPTTGTFMRAMANDFYVMEEMSMKKKHPHLLLTSPWVRPENLKEYENLGITHFKLSGRNKPHIFLERCLEAYHSGSYEGNIFDIIDNGVRLAIDLRYLTCGVTVYYINNKELDGFFKKVTSCSKNCTECNFCEEFAKEKIAINKEVPQEDLQRVLQPGIYEWPLPYDHFRG